MTSRLPLGNRTRRSAVLAATAVLFAVAFSVRLAVAHSDIDVLPVWVLPIAILAVEFGLLGGLLGAGVAAGLLAVYVIAFDPEPSAWHYASRVAVFAGLAVLVAALADALRRIALADERLARESAAKQQAEVAGARLARLAEERRQLAGEVVSAEEEARRRIAEDLHDGPLQTLLSAKQDLIEVGRGRAGVVEATERVAEGIDGLRRAVAALHPVTIERDGIAAAVGALAAEAELRGRFRCEVRIEERMNGAQDPVLSSLARELLTNAAKHSGAANVLVSICSDRDSVLLEVADDGCGFDAAERLSAPADGHIGLACAERRARALGGSLAIAGHPGAGTVVSVRLPADDGVEPTGAAAAVDGL